jgi:hypothetical protein
LSELRVFARCVACGAVVADWQKRFTPVRLAELVITHRGELAVRVRQRDACRTCGEGPVEIRVEEVTLA